jgi:hypothetical protein
LAGTNRRIAGGHRRRLKSPQPQRHQDIREAGVKIIHLDDIDLIVRKTVRSEIDYRCLLTGTPGSVGNFKLILGTTHADYTTPRHRHNFDQIRFQLGGRFDYDGLGAMTPDMVGYFPEGTPYGPSASGEDSKILLLQYAGASGGAYLADTEYNVSIAALKQRGTFHEGIYTEIGADGRKRNKDGYEAVWENAFNRPIIYAKPRYDQPVFMRPENFSWVGQAQGVSYKLLGDFSERRSRIGFLGLAAGARHRLDSHSLYFVVSGEGRIGGQDWRAQTTIHIDAAEQADIEADTDAEIFHIGLPDLTGLQIEVRSFLEAR